MSNERRREKKHRNKVPVYVKDGELWVLYPKDRVGKEILTSRLNDVFENLEVVIEGNTPEFCLVEDNIKVIYEDGESKVVEYPGDWIVPEDEE